MKKEKVIIMPKFVEKEFPRYILVDKIVEVEKIKYVPKEVEYEVRVPKVVEVKKEVIVEQPKIVEKPYDVRVPRLKFYDVSAFKPEDVKRIQQVLDMLPRIFAALEKIVKFVPKEVPYEVKVPEIVKVPYKVDVPDYRTETVLRPHFQDVKILHPVIVETIMTLEEWNKKSEEERKKIGEIVKSHLRAKGK